MKVGLSIAKVISRMSSAIISNLLDDPKFSVDLRRSQFISISGQ